MPSAMPGVVLLFSLTLAAGCATLHENARSGDASAVAARLADGADPEGLDRDGHTPLHVAVLNGRHRVVNVLLEDGADADARGPGGATPLHYWALGDHHYTHIVRALLAAGASVGAQADDGATPLHWAAARGSRSSAHVQRRLQLPRSTGERSMTQEALEDASPFELLGVLLTVGVIDAILGTEPAENVTVLLEAGANARARDHGGATPLHWAVSADAPVREMTSLLLAGAVPWMRDNEGNTPLHWAAAANASINVVQMLLSAGADPAARNAAGVVASDLAPPDAAIQPLLGANQTATRLDVQRRGIYLMRVTIHGVAGCGDDFFGSPEYYAVVERDDAELWSLVNATVGEAERVADATSAWGPWGVLDALAQREEVSHGTKPLLGAEQQRLERLRQATDLSRAEKDELAELARRETALSPDDTRRLAQLRQLRTQWRSQLQRVRMQEGESDGHLHPFLPVYPNDVLRISLREDDFSGYERCFETTAVLQPSALERGSLEISYRNQVALTLHFVR